MYLLFCNQFLTEFWSNSSALRNAFILFKATFPWMIAAIPKGSKNKGPLSVLNNVKETKAVCESRIPPAMVVYVANDDNATKKGAQFQAKNWDPSKY